VLMQQQILWNGRSALDAAGYLLLELISWENMLNKCSHALCL
jgi:hypothetical protein